MQEISKHETLDGSKVAALPDIDLFKLFTRDNWNRLNIPSRQTILQEVENRQAKLDGRSPATVQIKRLEAGLHGYCSDAADGKRIIVLNEMYTGNASLQPLNSMALNTVLHEGRHSFQAESLQSNPKHLSNQILLQFLANNIHYFNGSNDEHEEYGSALNYVLYQCQEIEMDARRFARLRMVDIYNKLKEAGISDQTFEISIRRDRNDEINLINNLRMFLTRNMLDHWEETIKTKMQKFSGCPDLTNVRLFKEAYMILEHPEMSAEELLNLLDNDALNRLPFLNNKIENSLNRLKRLPLLPELDALDDYFS